MLKYLIFLCSLCWMLSSCADQQRKGDEAAAAHNTSLIRHARRFAITEHGDHLRLYVMGNRHELKDTSAVFVVYEKELPRDLPEDAIPVKIPCTKIAALSSIYASMLADLGCVDQLAAIDNIDYVNNPQVLDKFARQRLPELARNPEIDLEKTMAVRPDVIFYYGMGDPREKNEKLKATKIPVVISVDHLEETPLARAEWIRFFAVFAGQRHKADSIFSEVEKEYLRLKKTAEAAKQHPAVFSECKFGDVWYMPGGDSYMATLIKDAGGHYLWQDDTRSGSLPLSFEQVFARAADADFWINQPLTENKAALVAQESRYANFKAFKTGQLYNNTKFINPKGYSTYWETGMYHPERILNDLIWIFHPELRGQVKNDLYYYTQLR